MQIVIPFQSPELESQIQQLSQSIELIVLPPNEAIPATVNPEVLLTLGVEENQQLAAFLSDKSNPSSALKWLHVLGTGVDYFPFDLVGDRLLTCSRGAHSLPIAEWVMAMILTADKNLPAAWVSQPPEQWHSAELAQTGGKTLALLGFGSIGRLVAERALAFGMQVKVLARRPRNEWPEGVKAVSDLSALLPDADHVVLAAPATAATHHIINQASLTDCKQGAHLINVARGSLIDQQALREALDNGQLSLASLDVVDPEPLPAGHWLYQHESVRLSPHISWSAPQILERLTLPFVENIRAYLEGQPLQGLVDLEQRY